MCNFTGLCINRKYFATLTATIKYFFVSLDLWCHPFYLLQQDESSFGEVEAETEKHAEHDPGEPGGNMDNT